MSPEQTVRFQALVERTHAVVQDLEFIEYSHITMYNKKQYHTININIYGKGRVPRSADTVDEMFAMWDRLLNDPAAYT